MPVNSAAFSFPAFQICQNLEPFVAPICNCRQQPVLPFSRFGGRKFLDLLREPAGGVGARLRIMVQAQNQRADFLVAPVAVDLNQLLDGDGKFILAGVMRLKLFV